MKTDENEVPECFYSIKTTEGPDFRTSVALNFYHQELEDTHLTELDVNDLDLIAAKAVLAADCFFRALNRAESIEEQK